MGKSGGSDHYARIYAVVRKIPRGRVATYGQVAELAGLAGHARQVGYALHATPEDAEIPWQRVVNAKGEISARAEPMMEGVQQSLLEAEGIEFDANGKISLERCRWQPRLHSLASKAERMAQADPARTKTRPSRATRRMPKKERKK